jgi:hypothetical protein
MTMLLCIAAVPFLWAVHFLITHTFTAAKLKSDYLEEIEKVITDEVEKKIISNIIEETSAIIDAQTLNDLKESQLKQREMKVSEREKNPSFPIDYDFNRNRIVFVQQKGANGQTAYEYAFYEVSGDELILGKANFVRKLFKSETKSTTNGAYVGELVTYHTELTVLEQRRVKLNTIPEPHRTAIQLGALKTETFLSLYKQW